MNIYHETNLIANRVRYIASDVGYMAIRVSNVTVLDFIIYKTQPYKTDI